VPEIALYKLEPITDNPKFEGFAFVREESVRGKSIGNQSRLVWDFGPDDIKARGRSWTAPRLAPFWSPQPVIGQVKPFNDYPCVNLTIPAFSRRAVDALSDFLVPNGELLPLVTNVGEYFAYNTTTIADVLDQERTEIRWLSDRHTVDQVFEIDRYECVADRMRGLSIFRLVEMSSRTYVSQVFVDRVNERGLRGFHFIKLWPLSSDVDWREEDQAQRIKESLAITQDRAFPIKGNTVVLFLPIAKPVPAKAETSRLEALMNELDSILTPPMENPNAAYSGCLEGNDYHDNYIRLFLSCPSADILVEKIRPWLQTLSWNGTIKVLKRYGDISDIGCQEEYVDWR